MPENKLEQINNKLIEILSKDKGYFGRIYTWGHGQTKYEYIGYELDTDFMSTLILMSSEQRKNLIKIINYFDIHAGSLKRMLVGDEKKSLHDFCSEWAWSHFMTVIMFGMIEIAIKINPTIIVWKDERKGYINKFKSIEAFLKKYLPQNTIDNLVKKYKDENEKKLNSFSDVIKHLWLNIRSNFIHDGGIHYKGLEWTTFKGMGTKEDPIRISEDTPMQELMRITWLAILKSYGYTGSLELPRYKN